LVPTHHVKDAFKLLLPALPSTITIKQQLDTATKSILADPNQGYQILITLGTNAFHAMEQTVGIPEISLNNRKSF
jgi:nitrogen-specific signal transduction histidine kinase